MKKNRNESQQSLRVALWLFVAGIAGLMGLTASPAQADLAEDWGYNYKGQLGNGTTTNSTSPVMVTGMSSGVTAIAGGGFHSLAVQNGGVYAWGF